MKNSMFVKVFAIIATMSAASIYSMNVTRKVAVPKAGSSVGSWMPAWVSSKFIKQQEPVANSTIPPKNSIPQIKIPSKELKYDMKTAQKMLKRAMLATSASTLVGQGVALSLGTPIDPFTLGLMQGLVTSMMNTVSFFTCFFLFACAQEVTRYDDKSKNDNLEFKAWSKKFLIFIASGVLITRSFSLYVDSFNPEMTKIWKYSERCSAVKEKLLQDDPSLVLDEKFLLSRSKFLEIQKATFHQVFNEEEAQSLYDFEFGDVCGELYIPIAIMAMAYLWVKYGGNEKPEIAKVICSSSSKYVQMMLKNAEVYYVQIQNNPQALAIVQQAALEIAPYAEGSKEIDSNALMIVEQCIKDLIPYVEEPKEIMIIEQELD